MNHTAAPAPDAAVIALTADEVDCVVAVMLKVLDGKCKMGAEAKAVMTRLYDDVKAQPGHLLPPEVREVIALARRQTTPELREAVHGLRVQAEAVIPRPVMKAFKARLRRDRVLPA